MEREIDTLSKTIHKYLERNLLNNEDPPWEIRKSNLGGFGIFATRPIEMGELVFKDYPLSLGPRAALTCPLLCVSCYGQDNLKPCVKECGLQLCMKCQNYFGHQKECKIIRQWTTQTIFGDLSNKLVKMLSIIRSLLLSDEDKDVLNCLKAHRSEHGCDVDIMKNILHLKLKEDEEIFMRFICSVMDTNAFEVIVGNGDNQSSVEGVYPLGSFANHSCTPNIAHTFDNQQQMIVRAANFIPQNAEMFLSYTRYMWGTPTRRFYLHKTKHFLCKCPRCEDPTEFRTYMSAILCKVCKKGRVIPIDPLIHNGKWQCEGCGETVSQNDVAELLSLLGATLNSFTNEDLDSMLRFTEKKLLTLVPENNETVVELKYKIIWILGYQRRFTWPELSDGLLHTKAKFCRDLLTLLEMLNLGHCKMRTSLLHKLNRCYKEMQKREERSGKVFKIHDADMKRLLGDAAGILKYDAGALAPNRFDTTE